MIIITDDDDEIALYYFSLNRAITCYNDFLNRISPMGNSGCLLWGKPAAKVALPNLRCMLGVLIFP